MSISSAFLVYSSPVETSVCRVLPIEMFEAWLLRVAELFIKQISTKLPFLSPVEK